MPDWGYSGEQDKGLPGGLMVKTASAVAGLQVKSLLGELKIPHTSVSNQT